MSVSNGDTANQTTFNSSFMSREVDTSTVGKIDASNVASESGTSIVNIQRELNAIAFYSGKSVNVAKDTLPVWANNYVGASGDDLTDRANALTDKFAGAGGHTHTGADGEGDMIAATTLSGILPLANGGTNSALTASAGGVAYSASASIVLSQGMYWNESLDHLGIGNSTPSAALDISTDFAIRLGSTISTTGTLNNVSTSNVSTVRFTGASAQTITGFANAHNGKYLTIINASAAILTVKHNDSGSSSANRVSLPGSADLEISVNGAAIFYYDVTSALWRSAGSSGGSGGGALDVIASRAAPSAIVASAGIDFGGTQARQMWFIEGAASGLNDISATPQIASGLTIGQELILVGRNNAKTVYLEDVPSAGVSLNGAIDIGENMCLSLVWDGASWVEMSRR